MEPVIDIRNLGKSYKIAHQQGGYIALRDVLMNILKSPFKYAKDKAAAAVGMQTKEDFWALKDINVSIQAGEVIGIIGHNGAGKSTLLKILSQITPPTEGEIIVRGRIGSLLEVGTGFNPELTGRENIFLNGAIIGMTRKEIAEKFDQIVEFAGIGRFLDTPVKYYSSGMYVRLAFSVAAHIEPDILIVDEVLAVGDAEFQRKCLNKMEEVTKKDGRTIIFVSHNMAAIEKLCKKAILLNKGQIEKIGPTPEVIEHYIRIRERIPTQYEASAPADPGAMGYVRRIQIEDDRGNRIESVPVGRPWKVRVSFVIKELAQQFMVAMSIRTAENTTVRTTWSAPRDLAPGTYDAVFSDPNIMLSSRTYSLSFGLSSFRRSIESFEDLVSLKVTEEGATYDRNRILTITGGEIFLNPMDVVIDKVA